MSNLQFFMKLWRDEQAILKRVFEALPQGKLDYRPHPRSRSAHELVELMLEEGQLDIELIDKGKANILEAAGSPESTPGLEVENHARPTPGDIAATHEAIQSEVQKRLEKLSEEEWKTREVRILFNGQDAYGGTLERVFWVHLLDMIHHRGQLSTYIRPMGGKVPSIYGPSGDFSQ